MPTGVTVNFYQAAGYILGFGGAAPRDGKPKKHGGTPDQSYSGARISRERTLISCVRVSCTGQRSAISISRVRSASWQLAFDGDVAGDLADRALPGFAIGAVSRVNPMM